MILHTSRIVGDALELLDELLEEPTLKQAVREVLEALRNALEWEIV
jgi:hypothetical protein